MFLIKIDADLITERGYLKNDIKNLKKELKNFLVEKVEDYLDYIKNEDESIIEKKLNK